MGGIDRQPAHRSNQRDRMPGLAKKRRGQRQGVTVVRAPDWGLRRALERRVYEASFARETRETTIFFAP